MKLKNPDVKYTIRTTSNNEDELEVKVSYSLQNNKEPKLSLDTSTVLAMAKHYVENFEYDVVGITKISSCNNYNPNCLKGVWKFALKNTVHSFSKNETLDKPAESATLEVVEKDTHVSNTSEVSTTEEKPSTETKKKRPSKRSYKRKSSKRTTSESS